MLKSVTTQTEVSFSDFNQLNDFSVYVSTLFNNTSPQLFKNHILSMLSLTLASKKDSHQQIDELYSFYNYQNAFENLLDDSDYIFIYQGKLENEFFAKKALTLLLLSESNELIRSKIIQMLKDRFPRIYKSVKNNNQKFLYDNYEDIKDFGLSLEGRYDRSVYFYFAFYCFKKSADPEIINLIVHSSIHYELSSPINIEFEKEFKSSSVKIEKIKTILSKKIGQFVNYEDIVYNPDEKIEQISLIYENLFCIHSLNIHDLLTDQRPEENNDIYLAISKSLSKIPNDESLLQMFISSIFVKSMIIEYQKAKNFFYDSITVDTTISALKISDLEEKLKEAYNEIDTLNNKLSLNQSSSAAQEEIYNKKLNNLTKTHYNEMVDLKNQLKQMSLQLEDEKLYHQELYRLREMMFHMDSTSIEEEEAIALSDAIKDKNILIVGGDRNWRRKLMEQYPQIRTISGSNVNIDLTVFKQADCVLFFTNHISHSVYNRIMNYIRLNRINFGYIKMVNSQLLEKEIISILRRNQLI